MENITYVYLEKKISIWEYVVLVWLKTPLLSFPLNVCFFFFLFSGILSAMLTSITDEFGSEG